MLPASQKYTSEVNGRVTLRIESGADITPVSVPGLLASSAEKYGNLPALNYKSDDKWVQVTYKYDIVVIINSKFILNCAIYNYMFCCFREYEQNVRIVAKAFLKLGLERYHGVCIIGFNSPEWFYSDLGAIYAG